jgi:hypothetical protein
MDIWPRRSSDNGNHEQPHCSETSRHQKIGLIGQDVCQKAIKLTDSDADGGDTWALK